MEGSIEGDFYFPPIPPAAPVLAEDPARKQQEAIDKAVQEAVRRSNELAAKERAALEASMVKMLQEALARQNAQLEEARRVRDGATRVPPDAAAAVAQPAPPAATPKDAPPRRQASAGYAAAITSDPSQLARTGVASEWDYQVHDVRFNTTRKLTFRLKAMVAGTGSLEQVYIDGKLHGEWVADGRLTAIGVPTEASFVFSPFWNGANPGRIEILTPGMCTFFQCEFRITRIGQERINLPAGSFDATRIDGYFNGRGQMLPLTGRISLWYSAGDSRLLRQSAQVLDGKQGISQYNFQETIELSAIRTPGP
jgi:hypothetical protein